jgi:antitoxin YefM
MGPIDVLTEADLRERFAEVLEEVADAQSHVFVTRENGRPLVVMSFDEYRSWAETIHLMKNPGNYRRLLDAMAEAEAGRLQEHELIDPDQGRQAADSHASMSFCGRLRLGGVRRVIERSWRRPQDQPAPARHSAQPLSRNRQA